MDYPEYAKLSIDELQAEFVRLASVYADASDRRLTLLSMIEQQQARASATAKVSSLSEDERTALRVALDSAS